MAKKTEAVVPGAKCSVSRKDFNDKARSLQIKIGEESIRAEVKEFSTGSFGWHAQGKLTLLVGDVEVKVQANLLFTVVNSKEAE